MAEDVQSISSSRLVATEVARHSFGTVRRGFDPQEVRSYLELVARELSAWEQHEQELRRELTEAQERARHPVIDEAALTAALGQQSAQVLRSAHEEAARITREAEESAAAVLHEAQRHAAEVRVQAETAVAERIAEAEIASGSVHQQAERDTAQMLDGARAEGEAMVARAREQGQAMIDQAQESRRRVLADMAQRRRAMTVQIEQFRAARDELAASVLGVRDSVDRIVGDLGRADDAAREAAAEVARRESARVPSDELAAEVERADAALDAGAVAAEPTDATAVLGGGLGVQELGTPPGGIADLGGPYDAEPFDESVVVVGPAPDAAPGATTEAEEGALEPGPEAAPEADTAGDAGAAGDAGGGGGGGDAGHVEQTDVVEGLFARLRAGQEGPHPEVAGEASDGGPTGAAEAPGGEPGAGDGGADDAGAGDGGAPGEAVEAPGDLAQGDGEVGGDHEPAEGGEDGGDGEGEDAAPDPDDALRARGAELLDPVVAVLSRRLKRALQDDQNALLDRLRSGAGAWSDDLLPSEEEQRAHYADAAAPALRDAAVAGITMAREVRSGRGRPPSPDAAAVAGASDELATTVVTLLRRRLSEGEPGDADAPAARVGAAYREWRGERIERLVGDCALAAFSSGVLTASGKGPGIRWLVGGAGPPCADCDDNSLAGTVSPGDDFPTGHRHPPAHAGCRCLVVPTPA